MASVLGIGGVFFRSPNPNRLAAWYRRWLSLPLDSGYAASFDPGALPNGAFSVWAAFRPDSKYFTDSEGGFVLNLIVDDLDGALAQVREGGAAVSDDVHEAEYGRFGWFVDPDGNKVELWEPQPPGDPGAVH